MTDIEKYNQDFQMEFNSRSEREAPGSAAISRLEINIYRKLIQKLGGSGAKNHIEQFGVPFEGENATAEDLGETAYKHFCVVAAYLLKTRGPEKSLDTIESYATKNRFDRWVERNLILGGRFKGVYNNLSKEWYGPIDRNPKNGNPDQVEYPVGVDNNKIFGIAKPHRYWPTQLLRYLEYARLGKVTNLEEVNKLGINLGEEEKYTVKWNEFNDIVRSEKSVNEIAAGVAIKTMCVLKRNGLSDEQITKMILAGYSPGGPLNEHGNIPQIGEIWKDILKRVENDKNLVSMTQSLQVGVENAFDKKGFTFKG